MKFARIENNTVLEVIEESPQGRYHPSIIWTEVPEDVQQNWKSFDGRFLPATHYILQRQAAYPNIVDYIDGVVKQHSDDPAVVAEGNEQVQKYIQQCLDVKKMFPKSTE